MNFRVLLAAAGLAFAAIGAATDYELIVPRGWSFLQDAKTVVVSDPSGTIKAGDKITRILPGVSAGGPQVRVSAGWSEPNKPVLAESGRVDGFEGEVVLGDPKSAIGLAASLVPAGTGAVAPPVDQGVQGVVKKFPYLAVLGGIGGVIVLVTGLSLLRRDKTPAGAPIRFTGRKGIEEGVREIRAKIDEIQEQQKELVRKPPVLRSFRKQFESYDHRLRRLEAASQESREALSGIGGTLAQLEERLASLAQLSEASEAASKRSHELLAKLHSETVLRMKGVEEQVGSVKFSVDGVPARLADVEGKVQSAGKAAEAAEQAAKVAADGISRAEQRSAATGKSIDALGQRLSQVPDVLAANERRVVGLEERWNAVSRQLEELLKRVNSVEERTGAGAREATDLSRRMTALSEGFVNVAHGVSDLQTKGNLLTSGHDSLISMIAEVRGRLDGLSEGIVDRTAALAGEVGLLRDQIAPLQSMPDKVSSLGEKMGSLDDRLAPISARGDLLAQSFQGLQERVEGASANLSSQVERMESRLEELRAEGSRLAGLPEVASALHGNTAELSEHVRSAEAGLRGLGEELARLQEGLRHGARHSESLAGDITKRLEAWESSLSQVASRVEEIREEQVVEEKPAKRSRKAAKVEEVEEESEAIEEAEVAQEPVALVVEAVEIPKPAVAHVQPEPPAAVELEPAPITPLAIEEEIVLAKPVVDVAAVEKALETPELSAPEIFVDENFEDDEPAILQQSKIGRWSGLGGSNERTWSLRLAGNRSLRSAKGPIRPLTPIETPGIDGPVGSIVCSGLGAAYVQSDALRGFWPGEESHGLLLESPVPNDLWRLMLFAGYLYCVEERQVEVVHLSTWQRHSQFHGDYHGQTHTDSHWVGLMAWGGQVAVDFRDSLGNHVGKPRILDAPASQPVQLAASGNSAFIATRSGAIFRAESPGAQQIVAADEENPILSLSLVKGCPFVAIQSAEGIILRLLSKDGELLKEGNPNCPVLAHSPVIMGEKFYLFDDCHSELLIGSVRTLQVSQRIAIDGVKGVRRMVGLAGGKDHMLGMLATDERGQYVRALAYDPKSGQQITLCNLNQPRVEMIVGGHHFVVATSAAYQNTIQVFDPFEAAKGELKQAA